MKKIVCLLNFVIGSAFILIYYRAISVLDNKGYVIAIIAITAIFAIFGSFVKWRLFRSKTLEFYRFNGWRAALFLGIGLSSVLMTSFFNVAFRAFHHDHLLAVICYIVVVFTPLIYYLNHLNYIVFLRPQKEVSRATLGVVAIGSFILGVGITLLWASMLNIAILFFIEFCFLMIMPFLIAYFTSDEIFYLLVMAALLFFTYWLNFSIPMKMKRIEAMHPSVVTVQHMDKS